MTRLTVLFGATTLTAGIVAVVLWQQLHAERALVAQLQERVTQLEQRPVAAARTMPQVPTGPAPAAATPATPIPGQSSPNKAVASAAAAALVLDLSKDPELCAAQKASLRAQVPQSYPDAAKVLALSPAQSTALGELLQRQQERSLDMICGSEDARRQPLPSAAAQQAEIEALLGPAKYQEWQEYLPTREGRQRVNQLRSALANGDTPLTEQQAEPLLTTVLAEGKRRRDEQATRAMPTDPRGRLDYEEENIKLLEESQGRLLSSTQSYLSPQQVAVMKNSMTQQVAMQRAVLRARRAQMDAGTGNTVTDQILVVPR